MAARVAALSCTAAAAAAAATAAAASSSTAAANRWVGNAVPFQQCLPVGAAAGRVIAQGADHVAVSQRGT